MSIAPEKSYYPRGGMSGFKALLAKKLQERGVHIHPFSHIKELVLKQKNLTALSLGEDAGPVSTKAMVFNTLPAKLLPMLPKELRTASFNKKVLKNGRWGRWRTLYVGMEADRIPVGMGDNFILDGWFPDPVRVEIVPIGDGSEVPEGKRLLKISSATVSSYDTQRKSWDYFSTFEEDVFKTLDRLIPFLAGKYEVLFKHDGDMASSDDYLFDGFLSCSSGLGTLSPLTPYDNIFLAGNEILPALGIEGSFISAELTANQILYTISRG
jgi:phytoene dehydrogenase-like protein